MPSDQQETLLEEAAAPARERMKRDAEQAPDHRFQRLLGQLSERLFDAELVMRDLYADLKNRDNSFATRFARHYGEPPMDYLRHRRLETSGLLLAHPVDIAVYTIGEKVGFKTNHGFGVAFKRWAGISPGDFRKRARALAKLSEGQDTQAIAAAFASPLSPAAQRTLSVWLRGAHPELLPLVPPLPEDRTSGASTPRLEMPVPDDLIDAEIAEELPRVRLLWRRIYDKPSAKQIEVVKKEAEGFRTAALFYWLREASRLAARDDPARGLELAKLALIGVRASEVEACGDGRSEVQAQAWVWLGNQKRKQRDFPGAEQAFSAAECRFPEEANPVVVGEFYYWKAHLLWFQQRTDDALELLNDALGLFRREKARRLYCEALILRAIVQRHQGNIEAAIVDYNDAIARLRKSYRFQLYSAYFGLVRCYCDVGKWEEASALLPRLQPQATQTGRLNELKMLRLEAQVLLGLNELEVALRKLSACRLGLFELCLMENAALVALDLAVVFAHKGDFAQASLVAGEVIPLLTRLKDRPKALKCLRILKPRVDNSMLDEASARQARELLESMLQSDPALLLDEVQVLKLQSSPA